MSIDDKQVTHQRKLTILLKSWFGPFPSTYPRSAWLIHARYIAACIIEQLLTMLQVTLMYLYRKRSSRVMSSNYWWMVGYLAWICRWLYDMYTMYVTCHTVWHVVISERGLSAMILLTYLLWRSDINWLLASDIRYRHWSRLIRFILSHHQWQNQSISMYLPKCVTLIWTCKPKLRIFI